MTSKEFYNMLINRDGFCADVIRERLSMDMEDFAEDERYTFKITYDQWVSTMKKALKWYEAKGEDYVTPTA